MAYYRTIYPSPVGRLHIISSGENVVGLWMDTNFPDEILCYPNIQPNDVFEPIIHWLDQYFQGTPCGIDSLPIQLDGTAFRLEVWEILKAIPFGQTMSYGEIADLIAARRGIRKMSAQAVGQAVGANPISIVIPCHRVIGKNGTLTGYGGGLEIKNKLLQHEKEISKPKRL